LDITKSYAAGLLGKVDASALDVTKSYAAGLLGKVDASSLTLDRTLFVPPRPQAIISSGMDVSALADALTSASAIHSARARVLGDLRESQNYSFDGWSRLPQRAPLRRRRVDNSGNQRIVVERGVQKHVHLVALAGSYPTPGANSEGYLLVYQVEQLLRDFVALSMKRRFGDDWGSAVDNQTRRHWEKTAIKKCQSPIVLREWLEHADLDELITLIEAHFAEYFDQPAHVVDALRRFKLFRLPVAHCNDLDLVDLMEAERLAIIIAGALRLH
jgi:hypothetical protein